MVEPVTIVSSASVARLAREAGLESLDARRFRSLFELDGCARARGGRRGRAAASRSARRSIEVGEPVIRCAVTTRDPDTGERDLDTLAADRRATAAGARTARSSSRGTGGSSSRAGAGRRRGRGGLTWRSRRLAWRPEASGEADCSSPRRIPRRSVGIGYARLSRGAGRAVRASRSALLHRRRASIVVRRRPRPAEARAATRTDAH